MTTFGLVHGAFHGGWCWDLVSAELERSGHRAIAMDLPCTDPDAGAARYAEVVAEALEGSGGDVVLVGHSLAGLVIPVVSTMRPARRLIYLSAFLPRPGRSFDAASEGQPIHSHYTPSQPPVTNPDGSTSFPHAGAVEYFYQDCSPQLAGWAASRLRPQRWKVTQEVTPLGAWPDIPSSYLLCQEDRAVNPEWSREVARTELGLTPVELPGGHSPFLGRPAHLAEVLVTIATS